MNLTTLKDDAALMRELRTAAQGLQCGGAAVAVSASCSRSAASMGSSAAGSAMPFTPLSRVRIGCIAKGLVAALAGTMAGKAEINLDEPLGLGPFCRTSGIAALKGTTLRQLLDHTHGLHEPASPDTQPDHRGKLCIELLAREVRACGRLAPPGALYSYGNLGSMLAAAVLEQRADCSFWQLWQREFAIGTSGSWSTDCASIGRDWKLAASEVLGLVERLLHCAENSALWLLCGQYRQIDAYCPDRAGTAAGWHYFGAGWFGQNGNFDGESMAVRFHPSRKQALVVACRTGNFAPTIAGRLLPESVPALNGTLDLDHARNSALLEGVYENPRGRLSLARVGEDVFAAALEPCNGVAGGTRQSLLRRWRGDVYVPESLDVPELPFVQGLTLHDGEAYCWNGMHLWKGRNAVGQHIRHSLSGWRQSHRLTTDTAATET